jgi:hypothetical protein
MMRMTAPTMTAITITATMITKIRNPVRIPLALRAICWVAL